MAKTVDDRVVAMSFENEKFKAGVSETVGMLDKLKSALNFEGAAKGFDQLDSAANRVDLSHISNSINATQAHFSAMSIVGVAALAAIASKAIGVGLTLAKSLTLDPITEGFHNYETQINAVQTILANTGLKGAAGLSQVNGVLANLNRYANLTVYNFSQMAASIGTFTAAGVGLNTAAESIKGIANLAALSGSSSEQASGAMYQLSQAIAAGSVKLQDWNSVVNAGIGGKVFQSALFTTAEAMGKLPNAKLGETFDQWTKAGNSFRNSLSSGAQAAKAATPAISALATAQKEAARTIADAQQAAADSIASATESVKNAQQGVRDATRQGAKDIADAQQSAADSIASAAQNVKTAQQNVSDTARQSAKDIADAIQQETDTVTQSAQNVQNALQGVIDARRKLAEAMKPPSADELQAAEDALTTSKLDQADSSRAVANAQVEQTRAAQDLSIAQQQLAAVTANFKSTPDQILMAQRAVEDAQKRVTDNADAQTRALLQQHAATRNVDQAEQALQTTREKGTNKDQNVKTAQDALTAALKQYQDAQIKSAQDIAKAENNVRDVRIKSAEAISKAESGAKDAQVKYAQEIIRSETNLKDVRIRSAEAQASAGQQLVNAEKAQEKAITDGQRRIADAHVRAAAQINAAEKSINPSSSRGLPSWLTSDVLTNTLKQFAGDMTDAQLKAQGFTDAQIAHIQEMGKTATQAATNIKTFSQLTQALKEEVGTAWAAVFKTIFGNITNATSLFSKVHTVIENDLTKPIYAFNSLLQDWSKLGGRTLLIDALKNAFNALKAVVIALKDAWRDIFPPSTGNELLNLTKRFDNFTKSLIPTPKTLDELRRTFAGLFAIFDIGRTAVSEIFHVLSNLFGVVGGPAGGGFLSLTANVGDFLVKIDHLIGRGNLITGFFTGLSKLLQDPAKLFQDIRNAVDKLFGGIDSGGISHALSELSDKLLGVHGQSGELAKAWDKLTAVIQKVVDALKPMFRGLESIFQSIGHFFSNAFQNLNFDNVIHAVDTGLLGGIFLLFKRFFSGAKLVDIVKGGVFGSVKETIEGLTGSLRALQTDLKANALLQIAIAVGILSGAILVLSTIDPKKLNSALGGLTVAFGELVGALALLNKAAGGIGFLQIPMLAAGLDLLAGAVLLLTGSVKVMSGLRWEDLLKGLAGVGVLLLTISKTVGPISANSAGMITAGIGIVAIATGVRILASAVEEFSGLSWEQLAKGLSAVGATLVGIGLAARLFPTGMVAIGAGLVGISVAMNLLALSMKMFGSQNWESIAKGLASMAGAMGIIALAMLSMPPGPTLALQAVGLVGVAVALNGIALAMRVFGGANENSVIKGLLAMGGALAELAIGLDAMTGSISGAVALGVAAAAMALLVPALVLLGHQSVADIAKALIALAGALTILGVAGAAIAPIAPALLALGGALLAIGGGLALAGAGIALFGVGIAAIAAAGPVAIAVIIKAITSFAQAIPKFISDVVFTLKSLVTSIAKAAPGFVLGFAKILDSILSTVIVAMPKIVQAFGAIIQGALKAIRNNLPDLITTGLDMVVALLKGIRSHLPAVIKQAVGIITEFLNALADNMPKLVTSGTNLLIHFLDGISNNIHMIVNAVVNLVVHFVGAVADNVWRVAKAGLNLLTHFLQAILSGEKLIINVAVKLLTNFLDGVASAIPKVRTSATHMMKVFIDNLVQGALTLTNTAADAVVTFLNGIATAINTHSQQIWDAGWNIAWSIIHGMIRGIENLGKKVLDKVGDLITSLPKKAWDLLDIFSPSKVFYKIGGHIVDGLYLGLANNEHKPAQAVESMTKKMIRTINGMTGSIADSINIKDPVITPVLDLSKVKESSKLLPGYVNPKATIDLNANLSKVASSITHPTSLDPSTKPPDGGGPDAQGGVSFVQNNYSPKALTPVEVYRQTNNQISQLRRLPALAGGG